MYTYFFGLFSLLLVLSLQVLLYKAIVVAYDDTTSTVAHFADPKRGRMSWVVDESSLPWTGQYYYIESSQSPMSNLLVVVDSSNGNHLGNCASFAPKDNKWRRFFWILSEDSLICNITDSEPAISKVHFPPNSSPRTFSLRILAQQGPKCFRDMIVQNEKLEGCPPKLKRNLFQEMSLDCGCSVPYSPENPGIVSSERSSKLDVRTSVPPFHFVNSRISSSAGNSAVSHELFPGLQQSGDSAPVITSATTETNAAGIPLGTITATSTTTAAATEIQMVSTDGAQSSFSLNLPAAVRHGSELESSIIQEPMVSITMQELSKEVTATTTKPVSAVPGAVPEFNTQPCASIHCQNNGTCVLAPGGTAVCMCPEGFVGSQCEINLCASLQCMHGGVCRITGSVPRCECQPGTTGTFCEQMLCNPSCEQGGICALSNGIPVCHCPTGTIGINCNIIDTCSNNMEACAEYGSKARCQLDPNSFALISPVPVNATFKCLCLSENSEWFDCKQLTAKARFPKLPVSPVTTATPVILFPGTGNPGLLPGTEAAIQETPEQLRASQNIIRLFQNNPHFSHLFPNLIPVITSATTTSPTAGLPDANFSQLLNPSANETLPNTTINGLVNLFPALLTTTRSPAAPPLFGSGTTRMPIFFSASLPPFLITPKAFQFHHLFNTTLPPESNETSRPETTTTVPATTPTVATEKKSKSMNFANLTTLIVDEVTNPPRSPELPERLTPEQFGEKNATTTAAILPPTVVGISAVPPIPEPTIDGTTVAFNMLTFPEPEFPITTHISVPVTMIDAAEDSSGVATSPPLTQFTINTVETEGSTVVPVLDRFTDGDSLSISSEISTSSDSTAGEERHGSWSETEHDFTKFPNEMKEITTAADEFSTESVSILGEDEVKFVKLTVGLPTKTTTAMLPGLENHHPAAGTIDGNSATNDTARSGTSSWAIALAVFLALLVLAGACSVLVLRYIRRSRKLHGKYNPAREESVLSSSYSMPMTTVTKEERLI